MIEKQNKQENCSSVVDGFKFCLTSPIDPFKLGDNVFVNVFIQNLRSEAITIIDGDLDYSYHIMITDPTGNKVLTLLEDLARKVREGKSSQQELLDSLPINNLKQKKSLESQQKLKSQISLRSSYDFKMRGKYEIKIDRKIHIDNNKDFIVLSLDPIEIEIK